MKFLMSSEGGQSLSLSSIGVPRASLSLFVTCWKPSQNSFSFALGTVLPVRQLMSEWRMWPKSRLNDSGDQRSALRAAPELFTTIGWPRSHCSWKDREIINTLSGLFLRNTTRYSKFYPTLCLAPHYDRSTFHPLHLSTLLYSCY
jgi:hypothetical protein